MMNDKFYTYNVPIHTLLFSFIHIFIVPSEYYSLSKFDWKKWKYNLCLYVKFI